MKTTKYRISVVRLSSGRVLFAVKRPGEHLFFSVVETLSEAMDVATDDSIYAEIASWRTVKEK